jgi:hypothetical protein
MSATNLLLGTTGLFWALSAGTTIGELIACLALHEFKWGGYEVFLMNFIIVYGLLWAPAVMGESRARLASERGSESLPSVTLAASESGPWRLVAACGEKLLLISPASERRARQFKLVAAENIAEIAESGRVKQ